MLNWYRNLYVGDTAKKRIKKTVWKINHGAGVPGIYLVTLAANPKNQLEVFAADLLLQKPLRRICPQIIGVAKGYEEAVSLVVAITEEVYGATGNVNIRKYLTEQKEQSRLSSPTFHS